MAWVRAENYKMSDRERTVTSMHDTAEQLHVSAGTLYRSSQASPNETTTGRLQSLGDDVTEQAHDIDRRADRLELETPRGVAGIRPIVDK